MNEKILGAGRVAQVVECLLEALSSNPSITKIRERKRVLDK
jgi:hypothetical protein